MNLTNSSQDKLRKHKYKTCDNGLFVWNGIDDAIYYFN